MVQFKSLEFSYEDALRSIVERGALRREKKRGEKREEKNVEKSSGGLGMEDERCHVVGVALILCFTATSIIPSLLTWIRRDMLPLCLLFLPPLTSSLRTCAYFRFGDSSGT